VIPSIANRAGDGGDPDLPLLASDQGARLARVLRQVLRDVYFDQVNRDLRLPRYGGDYDIRPFPLPTSPVDVQEMKVRLRDAVKTNKRSADAALARRIQRAFALFMFGQALPRTAVEELFDAAGAADEAVAAGLLVPAEGRALRTNGLSLFSRTLPNGEIVYLFADTPPHFETRTAEQRVYAGADSYELMTRVAAAERVAGYCVEMGSGSGIQLIAALKHHRGIAKAIGVERDRRAVHVSAFNAALNGVGDSFAVVQSDDALRDVLARQPITFAMSNPPFIAVPAWIDLDADDCAWLRGVVGIRETADGSQADLRGIFAAAGWGGDDGLAVTTAFIDALVPLLADNSRMVIYSQFAGDGSGPSAIRDYVRERGGVRFEFEPAAPRPLVMRQPGGSGIASGDSRTILTAAEAAASVARLIVTAVLAREHPEHVRVAVRKGAREEALLTRIAARLDERYRRRGLTHFYDGFVVLTKERLP
jgi:hypothetical protein